jgi:dihydrofolate reductase
MPRSRWADICLAGGADLVQQYLKAGLVDEFQIHLIPILLGDGVRLVEGLPHHEIALDVTRVVESPGATHLAYRVVK